KEVAAEYSAIALSIAIIVEMIIKHLFIHKLSKFALFMYLVIFCFTVPAIIFNDIKYIQLKFYLFKIIFIIVNIVLMHKFDVNIMQKTIGYLIKGVSPKGWMVINYIFVVYMISALIAGLYTQYYISNDAWVFLKGVLLPIYGACITGLMIVYGIFDVYRQKKKQVD
ncbi:septation protein IspZ, partial [Psittacicella hinzii]